MSNDQHKAKTTEQLLQTAFVLPQTKEALQQRLNTPIITKPSFFSDEEFVTLQAVCNCLLPQPKNRKGKIDIAGILDTNLLNGKASNGWRYNTLPPDNVMYKLGLQNINQSAQNQSNKAFQELEYKEQEALLTTIQNKTIKGEQWKNFPSDLFFQELFVAIVEIYYSHPFGKDEIGDTSFADAKGWHNMQLNGQELIDKDMIQKND